MSSSAGCWKLSVRRNAHTTHRSVGTHVVIRYYVNFAHSKPAVNNLRGDVCGQRLHNIHYQLCHLPFASITSGGASTCGGTYLLAWAYVVQFWAGFVRTVPNGTTMKRTSSPTTRPRNVAFRH